MKSGTPLKLATQRAVARYSLSSRAESDLREIADFTINTFGIDQARRYGGGLEECFQSLADNPLSGGSAREIVPRLRRIRHESHVVFYLPDEAGVFIVRVLHQRMDFRRHL